MDVPSGKAVLSVSSGMGAQPGRSNLNLLAGVHVFLLNDNIENVLAKSGYHPPAEMSPVKGFFSTCRGGAEPPDCQKAKAAVGPVMVGVIQLDTNGNGQTQPGPPGTYYLLCLIRFKANGQSRIWNFRVTLKPGPNSVTLDQRNAASLD
jgi:hypothetical protein